MQRLIHLSPFHLLASSSREDNPIINVTYSLSMRKHLERIDNGSNNHPIYWQYFLFFLIFRSEGALPHWILINFLQRKRAITRLILNLGSGGDESYAPMSIIVQGGDIPNYLIDVAKYTFVDDHGSLTSSLHDLDLTLFNNGKPLLISLLKIIIISNCANGKDSRITSLQVLEDDGIEESFR